MECGQENTEKFGEDRCTLMSKVVWADEDWQKEKLVWAYEK
jgi:hypothetical protein